jgi:hypothetical protein
MNAFRIWIMSYDSGGYDVFCLVGYNAVYFLESESTN